MNREILRLAVPNILSNISVPLISSVDTALMGHLSEQHLGAVGIGSMIFNFIYWNFGFLRMGTTGITAQAYGGQSRNNISDTLGRALIVSFLLALLLFALIRPMEYLSLYIFQVIPEQEALIAEYFRIRIIAAPATLALYAIFGWLFGMQNAWYPLLLTIIINVINISLSYYLVVVAGWEISGVAWGTVIAQYSGLLVAAAILLWRYNRFVAAISSRVWRDLEALILFLTINRDIFIRTLCLTIAFGLFYSLSSSEGALILAVNVVLLQFVNWMSYAVDGFAYAAESLVGKYRGRRDFTGTSRAINYSLVWGFGFALLFSIVYGVAGEPIFRLFTDQQDVLAAGRPYLFLMMILPLAGFACYIWDGIFIGLTAGRAMRNAMLMSLVVYVFMLLIMEGKYGLWISLIVFLFVRGLILYLMYRRWGWEIK